MTISRRHAAVALASLGAAAASGPAFAQEADTAAVAAAVVKLTEAMLAADKARLDALTADQLSYGHSSGVVQSKSVFIQVIAEKQTVYKSIELSSQSITLAGSDAIVRHDWLGESGPGDRNTFAVSKLGVLQVWQKQGADWKLLARQAFVKPAT